MALGSVVLGTATLGIGLLVGGIIFNVTGSSLSKKADEAWNQMLAAEKKIKTICAYLSDLNKSASVYYETLNNVAEVYYRHLNVLDGIVTFNKKTDWNKFTEDEKLLLKNTVMLVQLLYTMCQVKLVYATNEEGELNTINKTEIDEKTAMAEKVLEDVGFGQ